MVYLRGRHRRVGGIDDGVLVAHGLEDALRLEAVALLLDVAEIRSVELGVGKGGFVGV